MYLNKNKLKILCSFLLSILLIHPLSAQDILKGKVYEFNEEGKEQNIIGANIYWANTTIGTFTIGNGTFDIERSPESQQLVVSYVGYTNDTITVTPDQNDISILLETGKYLDEISVTAKNKATFISSLNPIKVEQITSKELLKAACCNLSESFETNATVDVNYTDAVTGAKEIRILGLNGIYTQLLVENMPGMRGLTSVFGLDYIPGTWMESIQITKGTGSVVNGYESIAGQINVELQKPEKAEKLYLNLYANQAGRTEANLNLAHRFNEKVSTALLLHGNYFDAHHDKNDDYFLDLPNKQQLNMINRWKFVPNDRIRAQVGVKYLVEDREGGQVPHHFSNPYQILIDNKRLEFFSKIGWLSPKCSSKSLGLQMNYVYHELVTFYGAENRDDNKIYTGLQYSFYANLIYQSMIKNPDHGIRIGASFVSDKYEEDYNHDETNRQELVPGVFTEYAYSPSDKFKIVVGVRADAHNLYGLQVSPRMHGKYSFTPESTIRFSAGRGFRKANVIAENLSLLATAREFEVAEEVHDQIESAWNMGINFIQDLTLLDREMTLSLDLYRTVFDNRTIIDPFTEASKILVYNLDGESFSNVLQVQLDYELIPRLDVRLAYKFEDVQSTFSDGTTRWIPLNARHRGLVGISYQPSEKWQIDATNHIIGKQLLNLYIGDENIESQTSPIFSTTQAQVSYFMKKWDFYVGANNLFDFRQENPIISAENPFSDTFNATNVWGPIFGRMVYVGMRFKVK